MGELSGLVIGILLALGALYGCSIFAVDVLSNYGQYSSDINFTSRYVTDYEKTLNWTERAKTQTESTQTGTLETIQASVTGSIEALKYTFESIGLIFGLYSEANSLIKIPSWVGGIIIAGLLIYIIFVLISAYQRYKV